MKILIVSDVYPPEISSASHLMQELAEGLAQRGHKINVVTSHPRYYLEENKKRENLKTFSIENNVNIIRVKTLPLHKVNFIIRGISQLILPFLFFKKIKTFIKGKIDIVIVYSPPLPLGFVGSKVKHYYNSKFILNIQDIFPQNAIDLGILRNKVLVKFFELMEKKIYRSADKIVFHSEGGRDFLIKEKEIPTEKIITIPNWVDIDFYKNQKRNALFREKYKLKDKFVFLFAGIFGPAQGLDFLIKVAKEVSNIKDIVFLLVGGGMEQKKIQETIKRYSLTNVIIKPFVSKEDYPYLLKDVDVGIVCLNNKNKTPFIPGKFLGYLAGSLPIVAFLNNNSDGFSLIEKAKCGYAVESNNINEAVKVIKKIYIEKEKLKEFGENGFNYALNNLTVDICLKKFEYLFQKNI